MTTPAVERIAETLRAGRPSTVQRLKSELGELVPEVAPDALRRSDELIARYQAIFDRFLREGLDAVRRDIATVCAETAEAGISLEAFARLLRGVYSGQKRDLLESMPVDPLELHGFFLRIDEYQNALFDAFSHARAEHWRRRQRETAKLHAEFFENTPFPAMTGDADLVIREFNGAALACFPMVPEELVGMPLGEFLERLSISRVRVDLLLERLRSRGVIVQEELRALCPRTNNPLYLLLSVNFVEDLEGRRARFQAMIQDITRIKWLERQAAHQMAQFGAVFYSTPVGLIFVDSSRVVQRINAEACRLLGLPTPDQVEGGLVSSLCEMIPTTCRDRPDLLALLGAVQSDPDVERRGDVEFADPHRLVGYGISPVRDPEGSGIGWLWILRDITEEVATANLKRDLTHMIVHDLKNPLTAIRGATFVIRQRAAGKDEPSVEAANLLLRNCDRMMQLIMNMLDVERLESGRLDLVMDEIRPRRFLESIATAQRPAAGRRGLRCEVAPSLEDARIVADANLLERVLVNLLSNAIKHTRPDGNIVLRVADEGPMVRFEVQDDGKGIPLEFHDKIFQKFGQAELRREGRGTDTGIGLTFCKLATEAHRGSIGLRSEVGRGSTFFVRIPRTPPATAELENDSRAGDTRPIRLDRVR